MTVATPLALAIVEAWLWLLDVGEAGGEAWPQQQTMGVVCVCVYGGPGGVCVHVINAKSNNMAS